MKHLYISLAVIAILTLGVAVTAPAQEILIWDHDLGEENVFNDPEGAGLVGCEFSIERSLRNNGFGFTTRTDLPKDLSAYDVIFITIGWFC
jgi:hypothetical protein